MGIITKPMLAEPLDPAIGVKYPVLATPKLDGIRCLRLDNRTLSRKFLDIPNRHVQARMATLPINGLDGELIVDGYSFNQIQSAIMSEDGTPDFRYYVFDVVTNSLAEPYVDRMDRLKQLSLPDFCVKVLPKLIKDEQELNQFEEESLREGYE